MVDRIETLHRDLFVMIREGGLTTAASNMRESEARYRKSAYHLNRLIEVRSQQRVFFVGPCDVCEVWGGL